MAKAHTQVNTDLEGRRSGDRLTRDDWVFAGLSALARAGSGALKADVLAKSLGVSRGSFYWHFTDLTAFHRAILDAWEDRATSQVIAAVDAAPGGRGDRLLELTRLVFGADGSLERQVRSWAAHDPVASAAQDRVDRRRVAYVKALFISAGFDEPQATLRARVLYLALIGQFVAGRKLALRRSEIDAMLEVLTK